MNQADLREKIIKRYSLGQIVNMRVRTEEGKISKRFKARILVYYPGHVLVERNGFKESFTYWDMHNITTVKKGERA